MVSVMGKGAMTVPIRHPARESGGTMVALTSRERREARSTDEALGLYPGDVGEVRGGAEVGCLRLPHITR
jgi:hypothetical protein